MQKLLLKINILGFIAIFLILSISVASRSQSDSSNIEDNKATIEYSKSSNFETLPFVEDSETQKVSFDVQPYNPSNKIVIEPLTLTYD